MAMCCINHFIEKGGLNLEENTIKTNAYLEVATSFISVSICGDDGNILVTSNTDESWFRNVGDRDGTRSIRDLDAAACFVEEHLGGQRKFNSVKKWLSSIKNISFRKMLIKLNENKRIIPGRLLGVRLVQWRSFAGIAVEVVCHPSR